MKVKLLFYSLLAGLVVGSAGIVLMADAYREQKEENERLSVALAHAQVYQPLQRDTIRDTVQVITQQIVEVERGDLVEEGVADLRLLRDLELRGSQLESIHQMGTQTSDTIRIYVPPDSVFRYHDHWTDIKVNIPDSLLTYSVRDSTQVIVAHEYKHRFLWWRWGVKGYKVKVVNFNPHATVLYNSYVKAK